MDTEQTNNETVVTELAAPVVAEGSPAAEVVDQDAAALAAFDTGVASVASDTQAIGEDEARTATDIAAQAAAEKVITPEDTASPAAGGAPLAVDHAKVSKPTDEQTTEDPETEKAVAEYGLKDKAAQRFREMSATIKTQAQEIEPLRNEAERGRQWEEMVLGTKASPEQFGEALGYLTYINSGDPGKMNQAFDFMLNELQKLGSNIGREVPGLVDPLKAHADLAQAVHLGEMPRMAALEVAQHRMTAKHHADRETATTEQARQQQAHDKGMQDVSDLAARLEKEDPQFKEKLSVIAPVLDSIRRQSPPDQWASQIQDVYGRIQLPSSPVASAPAPVARPSVGAMPLRATGGATNMQRDLKGASEMDAFNMGLDSVGR